MRPVKIPEGTALYTVAPKEKLGGILEFEAEQSQRNIRLGYYDAQRFLYGLRGVSYYIDGQWSEERARQFLCDAVLRAGGEGLTLRAVHEEKLPALAKRLEAEQGGYEDLAAALLEAAAERREVDRWQIYTEDELLKAVGDEAVAEVLASTEEH